MDIMEEVTAEVEVMKDDPVTMREIEIGTEAETVTAAVKHGVDIVVKTDIIIHTIMIHVCLHHTVMLVAIDVRHMSMIRKSSPMALLVIMGLLVLGVHGQNMSTPL